MTPEQLRASILQYAMEGKLVKQNFDDEPASKLIKKIEDEKLQLVKEGEIKKGKKLPAITDEEKPFDIPNNWEWVKLGNIVDYVQRGKSPKYDKESNSYPIISQKCVQWDGVHLEFAKHLKEDFWKELPSYRFVTKGDLLLNSTGTGTVGRIIKVTESFDKIPVDSHVTIIRLNKNVCNSYILYFLMSPIIQNNLDDYLTGTTKQKEFGLASIQNIVISIPPLEEQKRIVAKIEKLMPLVDEYAESYNRLQKIDNEFEDKLKQSVLQYAMEGKLVKQDPSDEPASELVKASSMEKSHNGSYKIPSSWEWVRLDSGVKFINGRAYKKTELLTDSNLTPVLRVGNLFTNSSWYYSDLKLDEDKYIDNGDLIYAWSASFGPRIWNGGHVIYHYHIWKTVIKKSIDKKFLYYFLSDPHNVLGETKLHGSTMKHVTKTNMEKLPFPLPPLEEQKRIVAKIEKIMNSINNH